MTVLPDAARLRTAYRLDAPGRTIVRRPSDELSARWDPNMPDRLSLPDANALIRTLDLRPHPEGGYFRETYRSASRDADGRCAATMIYFLLTRGQVSRFHRIDADEGWHLYLGGPLEIYELDEEQPEASPRVTVLGTRMESGEQPQHLVPAGRWFGASLARGVSYALVGCTVAPGFEFSAFELGDRDVLAARFPRARDLIERFS
jgi:predicted cupin superfamily sugar epimerase